MIRVFAKALALFTKWVLLGGWVVLHVLLSSVYQSAAAVSRQAREEWERLRARRGDDEF
jgi:hypothetical protein